MILFLFLPHFYFLYLSQKNQEYSSNPKEERYLDSILVSLEIKKKIFLKNEYPEKIKENRPLKLFVFDPNSASENQFLELGIENWMCKRIIKFREKGGKFYKKADLLKIYDFPALTYKKLEPYIEIKLPEKKIFDNKFDSKSIKANETISLIKDVNLMNETDWQKINGIGQVLASRIIKYRNKLGGFVSEKQLSEVYGLDSLLGNDIAQSHYIEKGFTPNQLNINTATYQDFISHPYFDSKKANFIINYRKQHGNFLNLYELSNIIPLNNNWIEKIKPYLKVD